LQSLQVEVGLGVFFTGLGGTFGVRCRYLVAASLEVPPLCICVAMFHLLGSVGDIAFLFGLIVGAIGRLWHGGCFEYRAKQT